jgi:RHS repeat-associated protein
MAHVVTFKYDPLGRRIEKISPTTTSVFAYDGDNLVETTNASGGEVASYTQTQNIDEPLAMLRGTTKSFYEADGLGSITSLSNTSGTLAQTYTYDSFGNTTNSSGSLTDFLRYTSREFDSETGLYFDRFRYYDSQSGRFLSEDPMRFNSGGDFYVYVEQNPLNAIDPFGLSSLVYNNGTQTLTVVNGQGNVVGTFPASNNAQTGSRGPWEPGTYDYAYHATHPDDAPDSPYGSNGNFVFKVPGCTGCGVHSGRAYTPDRAGRKGPGHATNGCIRTTDDATSLIEQLIQNGDPLTTLTVAR